MHLPGSGRSAQEDIKHGGHDEERGAGHGATAEHAAVDPRRSAAPMARGVAGLFPAAREGDDTIVYADRKSVV